MSNPTEPRKRSNVNAWWKRHPTFDKIVTIASLIFFPGIAIVGGVLVIIAVIKFFRQFF